jgi:PAS domain S-box-containing protein
MDLAASGWKRLADGAPTADFLPKVILESWQRSERVGVNPVASEVVFHRVEDAELRRRLADNAELVAAAKPHLDWLSASLSQIPHVVYLTDSDGIVLYATGTLESMEGLGLVPGFDWSEGRMGTNGAGTALAANQPVAVVGCHHFMTAFQECTCTAAPIHGSGRRVLGAIDVTTSVADGSPDRLALAAYAAYVIEREVAYREEFRRVETDLARRDVTEPRWAEPSLLEINARLQAILDYTASIIYMMDTEGRFLLINRRWEGLFGLTDDMVRGRSVYDFFPAETADQFMANNRRVLETGTALEVEERVPQGDGVRTYLSVKAPIHDAEGRPYAICGISRDITDRKLAEERERHLVQELQEKDARKNEFLAMLAHELRNPLAPIRNAAQIRRLR